MQICGPKAMHYYNINLHFFSLFQYPLITLQVRDQFFIPISLNIQINSDLCPIFICIVINSDKSLCTQCNTLDEDLTRGLPLLVKALWQMQ